MRGVENLVNMRKRGTKPAMVWVELLPMQQWARQLTEKAGRWVDIHLDPKDAASVDLIDLRGLVGLQVTVNGLNDSTTERVARACFKAGACVVQAMFYDISNPYRIEVIKALRLSAEGEKVVWQQ